MRAIYSISLALVLTFLTIGAGAQTFEGPEKELEAIRSKITSFSQAYMDGEIALLAEHYSLDASILPPGADIIQGRAAIQKRWELPEGVDILLHKVTPSEIVVKDDTAWDYGYYEGSTKNQKGTSNWKGKYMIIWKRIDGEWLIYLDIWNRIDS